MERWFGAEQVPAGYGPSVVALGNFDGVHRGHARVLGAVVARARAIGGRAVAVTFDPHPLAVLRPEAAPPLLTTTARKLELLERTGLDAVLVLPFTRELAAWSPERFVADVLVEALGASTVCAGRDLRFGRAGSGSLETLRSLGAGHAFDVVALEDVHGPAGRAEHDDDGDRRWSSSWVRELLAAGDAAGAAEQLGRPHRVEGVVVHGDHRGRELGYPTANLGHVEVLVPGDGVYAGWLVRHDHPQGEGRVLPAAISVGTNPTFDGLERRLEAHALVGAEASRSLDLYGERVGVDVVELLRPTLRFESVEALVEQMDADVVRCREVLEQHPPLP